MNFDDIPGWFMPIDQALFTWILQHQIQTQAPGAVVELGAFKGKSAVVIGANTQPSDVFTVCDLFEDIASSAHADPSEQAFFAAQELSQAEFERIYLSFHRQLPRVLRAPSAQITRHVAPQTARFMHVDAGHSHALMAQDIASAKSILRADGVGAFGDYAKVDSMGSAAAIWNAVLNDGLNPICNSNWKMYATWGDPAPYQAMIRRRAEESGWVQCSRDVMIGDRPMVYVSRKP